MGWRATDLSKDDAHQQAADLNVIFNQYGQRRSPPTCLRHGWDSGTHQHRRFPSLGDRLAIVFLRTS
jgi:hypothetical protein